MVPLYHQDKFGLIHRGYGKHWRDEDGNYDGDKKDGNGNQTGINRFFCPCHIWGITPAEKREKEQKWWVLSVVEDNDKIMRA